MIQVENKVLQQILQEMKTIHQDMSVMNQRFEGLENGQTRSNFKALKSEVESIKDSVWVIENEHGMKINALYDAHMNTAKGIRLVGSLEEKVDDHESRIWALEQAVKAN